MSNHCIDKNLRFSKSTQKQGTGTFHIIRNPQILANPKVSHTHLDARKISLEDNPVEIDSIQLLSYAIKVAMANIDMTSISTCLVDMIYEKPIADSYQRYFADQYGPILALHWLPPLHFQFKPKHPNNFIYFVPEEYIAEVNEHIEDGLIEESLQLIVASISTPVSLSVEPATKRVKEQKFASNRFGTFTPKNTKVENATVEVISESPSIFQFQ